MGGLLAAEADNLVLKAARLLADRAGVAPRAAIRLTKHVPVAAGLGGGSADAAAVLHELIDLWRVAMPQEELFDLAARLGADVPMCLAGRPALVSGVGEQLQPAPPLPACAILLVNPVSRWRRAMSFLRDRRRSRRHGRSHGPGTTCRPSPPFLPSGGNDLTPAAISLAPDVGEVLAALGRSEGVRHAGMSGSGATCFALFDGLAAAGQAAASLPAAWWRHAGTFVSR